MTGTSVTHRARCLVPKNSRRLHLPLQRKKASSACKPLQIPFHPSKTVTPKIPENFRMRRWFSMRGVHSYLAMSCAYLCFGTLCLCHSLFLFCGFLQSSVGLFASMPQIPRCRVTLFFLCFPAVPSKCVTGLHEQSKVRVNRILA